MKPAARSLPAKWSWHQRALTRLRETLVRERDEHASEFRRPIVRGGEDSTDLATDQMEHEELLAQLRQEETELAEIEAALDRIRKGKYGICELTGAPIEPKRLRAVPWTRLSHDAAANQAKPRG